jgi:hypothetical protein
MAMRDELIGASLGAIRKHGGLRGAAFSTNSSRGMAAFAGIFARTRAAYLEHEQAKTELKGLMPQDAKEAIGHGVRAKRSKSGAVSFDLLVQEGSHAAVE